MLFDPEPEPMYSSLLHRFTSSSKSTKKGFPKKMAESRVQTPASLHLFWVNGLKPRCFEAIYRLQELRQEAHAAMKAVQASVLITPTVGATYKIQVGDRGVLKRHAGMVGLEGKDGGGDGWGGWWRWWCWCCSVRKLDQLQKPVVHCADISFQSLLQKQTAWLIRHSQCWTCLFSLFKSRTVFS